MLLESRNLCFSYGKKPILCGVDLKIETGKAVALIGPNGCGKTTLFKCLLNFLKPSEGQILIDGKDISLLTTKELSNYIAYVPQNFNPVFNHSVLEIVLMGLANRLKTFESPSEKDIDKAMKVLKLLGIENLANQGCLEISGGELQLVLLARALMQDAKFIIMDEPTANLDWGNSIKVMNQVVGLVKRGSSVLISTHDPNLAIDFCSDVFALKDGKILEGEINCEMLSALYGVKISKPYGHSFFRPLN